MYPIDLMKVGRHFHGQGKLCADFPQTRMQVINPTAGTIYTGISNAFTTITRVEGLRTLWRGVSSVILGAGMLCLPKEVE